jgi:hypothetical protein
MEHPAAERSGPLPPDPLSFRRRRDGIPASLVTHHYPDPTLTESSRSEARRRRLLFGQKFGIELQWLDRAR